LEARRILLVLAIILLVTTAAASIVPVPEETSPERPDRSERPEGRSPEAVAPPADPGGSAIEVAFSAQGKPQARLVERDSHVIVTVEGPGPGEVELAGLGRIAPVGPQTPATFDLFTDRPGRFPVLYMPAAGGERRLGTLVVGQS
jgi:hypothetical protein